MSNDTTRDAFEAWFTSPIGTNFLVKKDGEYTLISAQTSWIAWQAATEQAKRQPLSDEELDLMSEKALFCRISRQQFARSIEAAHGITATPQCKI